MNNKDCKLNISDNQLDLIDEIGPDQEIGTTIQTINEARVLSPLRQNVRHFVSDQDRVLYRVSHASLQKRISEGKQPLSFELAGPRENIYFDPTKVRAAIVTCFVQALTT